MGSTRNGHTDTNHSNQGGSFNHSSGSSHQWRGMIPKVEMHKFYGKDPLNWITQMENFFDLHQILGGKKVTVASLYLEPDHFVWYRWLCAQR